MAEEDDKAQEGTASRASSQPVMKVPSPAMPRLQMPHRDAASRQDAGVGKANPGGASATSFSPAGPLSPSESLAGSRSSAASTILRNHSGNSGFGQGVNIAATEECGWTDSPSKFNDLQSSIEALRQAKAASDSARGSWTNRPPRQNSAPGFQVSQPQTAQAPPSMHGFITEDSGPEQEPSPQMQGLRDVAPAPLPAPALAHERSWPSTRNAWDAGAAAAAWSSQPAPLKVPPSPSEPDAPPPLRADGPTASPPTLLGSSQGGKVPERRRPTPPRTPSEEANYPFGAIGIGGMASASPSTQSASSERPSLRGLVGRFGPPPAQQVPSPPVAGAASALPLAAAPALGLAASPPVSEAPPRPASRSQTPVGLPAQERASPIQIATTGGHGASAANVERQDAAALAPPAPAERGASSGAPRLATASRGARARPSATAPPSSIAGSEALLAFKEQAAAAAASADIATDEMAGAEAAAVAVADCAGVINSRQFAELRSMRHPPPPVSQVTEAVAALFGLTEERWANIKRRLDASLITRIGSLGAAAAMRLPRARVERFQRLLREHPAFADRSLQEKVPAVAPLQQWCLAVGQLLARLHGDLLNAEMEGTTDFVELQDNQAPVATLRQEDSAVATIAQSAVPPPPARSVPSREGSIQSAGQQSKEPAVSEETRETRQTSRETVAPPDIPRPIYDGMIVEPELWSLSEAELMKVQDLRVGRKGVGSVTFHGETDCRGLVHKLHDLLVIEQGEVVVYPDARWKPPVGQGLNKPASVVLYGCMPKSQHRLADPNARDRYRQRVALMTEEKGAVFEDYNCEDGTWKFRVTHF